jgi:hypothetical protein
MKQTFCVAAFFTLFAIIAIEFNAFNVTSIVKRTRINIFHIYTFKSREKIDVNEINNNIQIKRSIRFEQERGEIYN